MNAYIYRAALYCEDCGDKIKRALKRAGKAPADPDDEYSYDSGEYPKGPEPDGGGEADGPQHCASDEKCVNAELLTWPGKRIKHLHGAETRKIGAFLGNPLTHEGVEYLCEMVSEEGATDYQKALHKLWIDYYRKHGYATEIAECVREEVRSHRGRYAR